MKNKVLIITLLIFYNPAWAQKIDKISIFYQKADEPPTKQGQPKFTINFTKDKEGNFVATHYFRNKKKKKLESILKIENEIIIELEQWRTKSKKTFVLSDLNLKQEDIKSSQDNNRYKLHFGVPDKILIQIDTFQFCQPYKMTRSISTGSYNFQVSLFDSLGKEISCHFKNDDIGQAKLDLQNYIFCFKLLQNAIPMDLFYGFDLFTLKERIDIVNYYLQMVECEGYHYRIFTKRNPKRTPHENRTMVGWNFVEYMKELKALNED